MQFASWKGIAFIHLGMILGIGCASVPEPTATPRPWILLKSKLPSASVNAFGVRFILRASSAAAVNAGVAEIKRLTSLYDPKSGSELMRINSSAYREAVVINPETITVLNICQKMYEISDHKFDVSFVPVKADSDPKDNVLTDWEHKDHLSQTTQHYFGKLNVLLDPNTRQVRIYMKRTQLNLNGMIRGYAMERAILIMQKTQATGGEILTDNLVSSFGTELKNAGLLCVENPERLGTCLYRITPLDTTRPLFLGFSGSEERKGAMLFDPKDVWTYRSGGVATLGQEGSWVQFASTLTTLMDDAQLLNFLKKDFTPKMPAVFFDQNQKTVLRGALLPFAKISHS